MANNVNEGLERKGCLITNVPAPDKKRIDGTKPIPKGKQLLTEKGGKK